MRFTGRKRALQRLAQRVEGLGSRSEGVLLSLRGRRQVGKSTLLAHFLACSKLPSVFYTATRKAPPAVELANFSEDLARSSLSSSGVPVGFQNWDAALRHLASVIQSPSVVVFDEVPYLMEGDPGFEGVLQRAWDRYLAAKPVLFVLVGSDLSMMELLGAYDRPLHQRVAEMVLEPFTLVEAAEYLNLRDSDAIDAYLVAGGFPRVLQSYPRGGKVRTFLAEQLEDSTAPLVVVGERIVQGEFPSTLQAGEVLRALGKGHATFESIAQHSGVASGPLTRTLKVLTQDKRVVQQTRPLSAKRSRLSLYHLEDPYLRFWLRFIGPAMDRISRGHGRQVLRHLMGAWPGYRGQAIESLVRRSLEHLSPFVDEGVCFGRFWDRRGEVEVDLVGADQPHAPAQVLYVGSIKWRERARFDIHDLRALREHRARLPGGAQAALVGVSRAGFRKVAGLDHALGAEDIVAAWRRQ